MHTFRRSITSRLILPLSILLLLAVIVPQQTRAFSPNAYFWSSPRITYVIDSSFSALGSNFLTALNDAINDWNASNTPVIFAQDSASPNHIGVADLGDRALATTIMPRPVGTNFRFTDFTLQINTRYLTQFYVGPRTSTPPPDLYDLRTVIRHELGHAVGLCHTWNNSQALMWPNRYQGLVNNVDTDAISGANYIFNPAAVYATPEGGCGRDTSPLVAAAGTYDDRFAEGTESYAITYGGGPNWTRVGYTPSWYKASGQTLSYTNLGGARANIKFTGSRITRRYTMAPNRGQAQIYIDGVYRETMNDRSPEIRWQIAKTWELPYGTHTLEVSNNTAGQYIDVDSFIVDLSPLPSGSYDDYQTSNIQYIGSWTASSSFPSAYNSTVHYSNAEGAAAGTTFRGSQVTYYYTKAPNRGYATVTIDGVNMGYINLFSSSIEWQASTTWNLAPCIHTIFIGVARIRDSNASDYYVDLDRFVVS